MTGAMGVRRLLLLAFFAYVTLDLGCPFVPGAFNFEPADSVEAVGGHRLRSPALPRVASTTLAATFMTQPVFAPRRGAEALPTFSPVGWHPHAGGDHTGAADPRPSAEDD